MAVQFVQPHRFSVDQYRRMTEIGLVPEDGTELIDGVVVAGMRPVRFSSDAYFRLGEEGILDEDERVELLDGEIVAMTPIGSRHSSTVARLIRILAPLIGEAELRIQDVLHLRDGYDPQPDAAVYRPRADGYVAAHPTGADALLIVEVADSTLLYDRTVKTERYAEAGIPEYWVVDLRRDVVIVSRDPVAGQFMDVHECVHGERWRSPALDGIEIGVADVLGPDPKRVS